MSKAPEVVTCPMEATCAMYSLFQLAGMQGMWQALYCHGNFQRCERYQKSCKGHPVPRALLPDGSLLKTVSPQRDSTAPKKR